MNAKEIFRLITDTHLKGDKLAMLMEDIAYLQYEPRFGVAMNKRQDLQKELGQLVVGAWNEENNSIETFFRLCYAANSLQMQLPGKTKSREKKIAKFLFERYRLGAYEDLGSYINAIRLM